MWTPTPTTRQRRKSKTRARTPSSVNSNVNVNSNDNNNSDNDNIDNGEVFQTPLTSNRSRSILQSKIKPNNFMSSSNTNTNTNSKSKRKSSKSKSSSLLETPAATAAANKLLFCSQTNSGNSKVNAPLSASSDASFISASNDVRMMLVEDNSDLDEVEHSDGDSYRKEDKVAADRDIIIENDNQMEGEHDGENLERQNIMEMDVRDGNSNKKKNMSRTKGKKQYELEEKNEEKLEVEVEAIDTMNDSSDSKKQKKKKKKEKKKSNHALMMEEKEKKMPGGNEIEKVIEETSREKKAVNIPASKKDSSSEESTVKKKKTPAAAVSESNVEHEEDVDSKPLFFATDKIREKISYSHTTMISEGITSSCPVVFTNDSRAFVTVVGCHMKVFSVSTGHLVRLMSASAPAAHSDIITSIKLNPSNTFQLYSTSLDGTIRLWDISDGTLLMTWDLQSPVQNLAIDPSDPKWIYVNTQMKAAELGNEKYGRVLRVLLEIGKSSPSNIELLYECGTCFCFDARNGFVVSTGDSKLFTVYHVESKTIGSFETASHISSIAIHPRDGMVALGYTTGEIVLWYCLQQSQLHKVDSVEISTNTKRRPVSSTVLHWHAHQVTHLAFTFDGVYLLSGGEEAVLVIWQLISGHRQYLPRLGAEISSISISDDQTLFAMSMRDNTIKVVSSVNLNIMQTVTGLKCSSSGTVLRRSDSRSGGGSLRRQVDANRPYSLKSGIVIEPRNRLVVLSGSVGCLQFYNAAEDRHVVELETVSQNKIMRSPDDSDSRVPPAANVSHVAFSRDGKWMATVDARPAVADLEGDINLKMWLFDEVNQSYIVNTRVEAPHSDGLTSLKFINPPEDSDLPLLIVTTSADTKFKIWQLFQFRISGGSGAAPAEFEPQWLVRSEGQYRSSSIGDACVSKDSSILAVACGPLVTLWDPYTNLLQLTLPFAPSADPILRLGFVDVSRRKQGEVALVRPAEENAAWATAGGGGALLPFLVAVTRRRVHVWNLVTGTIWWSSALPYSKHGSGRYMNAPVRLETDNDSSGSGLFVVSVVEKVPCNLGENFGTSENEGSNEYFAGTKNHLFSSRETTKSITRVFVFSPLSRVPIRSYILPGACHGVALMPMVLSANVEEGREKQVVSSANKDIIGSRILILSSKCQLQTLGAQNLSSSSEAAGKTVELEDASKQKQPRQQQQQEGQLTRIFGPAAVANPEASISSALKASQAASDADMTTSHSKDKRFKFMTGVASHLLPPPSTLLGLFFKSLSPVSVERSKEDELMEDEHRFGDENVNVDGDGDEMMSKGPLSLNSSEVMGDGAQSSLALSSNFNFLQGFLKM